MDRNTLIFAYLAMFLLFMAFKKATPEIDKTSTNIASNIVESDIDTSKIKSDRLQRKIYDIFRDIDDREEDDNIQSLIKREKNNREPKIWDQWGNWSTCSVTCGIGKIMRWRHCIGGRCSLGEKKAQLKTCTSAAC
ncbi:PREDICTED: thrombospondin-1-like [Acromyrmex echinatior]